jgi:hypothetical protein
VADGDAGCPAAEYSIEGGSMETLAVVGQPVGMDGSLGQGDTQDWPAGVRALVSLGSPAAADVSVGAVAGAPVAEVALVVAGMPSVVDERDIVAILKRAEVVGRQFSYIGLYEFVIFSAMRKRRLLLHLGDGMMDVITALAPQLVDASWNMVPFASQVVPCKMVGNEWVVSGQQNARHFVAAVPVFVCRPNVQGTSVIAHGLRNGFGVVYTVTDGDCGLDALNIVEGRTRGLLARHLLRTELRDFMIKTGGDPIWHSIFHCAQEQQEMMIVQAPAVAGCSSVDHRGASSVKEHPVSIPLPLCDSVVVNRTTGAPPIAGASDSASDLVAYTSPCEDAPAVAEPASEVEKAVQWGTGLPNPSRGVIRRLCASLDPLQAADIIKCYKEFLSNPPPKRSRTCKNGFAPKRGYRSTSLSQRLVDATLFTTFAAQHNFDFRERVPNGMFTNFLESCSGTKLSRLDKKRGSMYIKRALDLLVQGAVCKPTRHSQARASGMRRVVRFTNRKRRVGHQGRPVKASLVREMLYEWFSALKHSVTTRIPPKMVLQKGQFFAEQSMVASLQAGTPAVTPVINYDWLRNWRFEYGVSLRKPNRKWKVSNSVLRERLEICWCNVLRVRKMIICFKGYDPVIENFDQSPFHMNEVGSKGGTTLSIRGCGVVPVKEGHAATRERWTANTMVTSCPKRAKQIPPLELMFRASGGGERMLPKLQKLIPTWAPWLTVVTGPKGSYREIDVLTYMEKVLEPMSEGRDWRILLVDAFAPQMTEAVRRCAWLRGYVLCVHGGGATSVCQANDTDLHAPLKKAYIELEMADAVEQQRLRPHSVPIPRKVDCILWMASIWVQSWIHEEASKGFKKVGLTNDLAGGEDHLICREARAFWDDIGMAKRREDTLHDVEVEIKAGRLEWSYADVFKVIAPFPNRGRADFQPDDEGSSDDGGGASSDFHSDSGSESEHGDGDPEKKIAATGTAPAVDTRPLLHMSQWEGDAMNEHRTRMDTLRCVMEQIRHLGNDGLMVTLSNALKYEEKRARGRLQTHPAVAEALSREQDSEKAASMLAQTKIEIADRDKQKERRSIGQLKEQQALLRQRQFELVKATTASECLIALKSFEASDLGQGHKNGGTHEHFRARMQVLDRIRLRGKPLRPEQDNDWDWFKRFWDKNRVGILPDDQKAAWGSEFKNIANALLRRIADGECDALSKWMASESSLHLNRPALRC